MEFRDRIDVACAFKRLSQGVRELSRDARASRLVSALGRHRRRLVAAALILGSFALAIWAHDLAQAEALASWLKTHPPSLRMWKHALGSRGFRELAHEEPDARLIQRASRALPSLMDQEGSAWISQDSGWIAIFQTQAQERPIAFFCSDCKDPPKAWSPAGNGWSAFDPVLARLDQILSERSPAQRSARKRSFRDPREILY